MSGVSTVEEVAGCTDEVLVGKVGLKAAQLKKVRRGLVDGGFSRFPQPEPGVFEAPDGARGGYDAMLVHVNELKAARMADLRSLVKVQNLARQNAALAFVRGVTASPFGVLGQQLVAGKAVARAPSPDSAPGCCFVDQAELRHIRPPGGPSGAHGAAGAIYRAIGIEDDDFFPEEVVGAVTEAGDAKYFHYTKNAGSVHVIHTVAADLRKDFDPLRRSPEKRGHTRAQALEALAGTYANVLRQFVVSGQPSLRLPPLSGGALAGAFAKDLPALTWEALRLGHMALLEKEKQALAGCSVGLCIFDAKEMDSFCTAGFLPTKPTSGTPPSDKETPRLRLKAVVGATMALRGVAKDAAVRRTIDMELARVLHSAGLGQFTLHLHQLGVDSIRKLRYCKEPYLRRELNMKPAQFIKMKRALKPYSTGSSQATSIRDSPSRGQSIRSSFRSLGTLAEDGTAM
eukprot:CAMPEP_0172644502 /NCGR_PEP_ID=MMETSP1068-20121228/239243_1 /TAXON_ID=35684 /ORGANISM="Pseudopedinella elastica, Strain CCMP716" /LENGTH=456 /DNA_ID=CAMNT_0013458701 /DNA_START=53 /DNA_END=1424 /DNA_ORIENTATION=-